jgi:hypothetical protein
MNNLVFFNKEGDYLNIRYNTLNERYEGNLIFHENSSDTFKTIGLYMFENIDPIEFEEPEKLKLEKFQLFNENGFRYFGSKYYNEPITKIESINNDNNTYNKWIYGDNIDSKFPIGTQIKLDKSLFEFTNLNKIYTVHSTKNNAISIISSIDNQSFNNIYDVFERIDESDPYTKSEFLDFLNRWEILAKPKILTFRDAEFSELILSNQWANQNGEKFLEFILLTKQPEITGNFIDDCNVFFL